MSEEHQLADDPFFSIIIPMYNRSVEVGRAVHSCLRQGFTNFEIVVVDDASTDLSRKSVMDIADPRIVLVEHTVNQGVCPARNSGVQAARAEWLIFLDSDHELREGALETIYSKLQKLDEGIERLGFMYEWDDGRYSPEPAFRNEIHDYHRYVGWLLKLEGRSDVLHCTKKRTFDKVRFPDSRAYEMNYHLTFSKYYRTQVFADVLAYQHTQSTNRVTTPSIERSIREAKDKAETEEELLKEHGAVLQNLAPRIYERALKNRIIFQFLAGNKKRAIQHSAAFLIKHPFSMSGWAILGFGLLGRRRLAWAQYRKQHLHISPQ